MVETLDGTGKIELYAKETLAFRIADVVIEVIMDKTGTVTASIKNTIRGHINDADMSEAATIGKYGNGYFKFAKNATLGRQDTSADKISIKINSDGHNSFAIENDHKPIVEIEKVDSENHEKKLSGARFEIYTAKDINGCESQPGAIIGTYTTGSNGRFSMTLDYGEYFYREVKAPSGYTTDYEYVKFTVDKGKDVFIITVENDKAPVTPGGSCTYAEPTESQTPEPETAAEPEHVSESEPVSEPEPECTENIIHTAQVPYTGAGGCSFFVIIIALVAALALVLLLNRKTNRKIIF